ncbi:thioredoxin family protein [Olleya sp. HaHaR_3_96]|uniref:thioredoxin family protein n=1 Tax=Olleya sp. HaHaR_3_96 TaxID=2745560 RepID=UPI001C4E340D|nr:thioredoxin family protein [Olleya sp. HaHaR_3_96]QXP60889.1 thioredoxin family protein [Olleya sp. HaHaR_3_96]
MKLFISIALVLITLNSSIAQTINTEVLDDKGQAKLLGQINKDGLLKDAYKDWFNKNYDEYIANEKLINTFKDSLNNYTIKAFLGTWCGDSKKEVPRFYNVLELADFNMDNLEVFALDNTKDSYKKGPNGEEKGFNIHRVPTFIFYKDGKEINRIVEHPVETFERDIEKIVTNQRYFAKYYVANITFYNLNEKSIEDLVKLESNFLTYFPEYSAGSKELNTLGYWHLKDKQYDKAIYVFDLNTKLFPTNPNTFDSLGEAFFTTKNYPDALKNYNKVLELKPEDKNALDMISKIGVLEN